jgi:hypothetical protein
MGLPQFFSPEERARNNASAQGKTLILRSQTTQGASIPAVGQARHSEPFMRQNSTSNSGDASDLSRTQSGPQPGADPTDEGSNDWVELAAILGGVGRPNSRRSSIDCSFHIDSLFSDCDYFDSIHWRHQNDSLVTDRHPRTPGGVSYESLQSTTANVEEILLSGFSMGEPSVSNNSPAAATASSGPIGPSLSAINWARAPLTAPYGQRISEIRELREYSILSSQSQLLAYGPTDPMTMRPVGSNPFESQVGIESSSA